MLPTSNFREFLLQISSSLNVKRVPSLRSASRVRDPLSPRVSIIFFLFFAPGVFPFGIHFIRILRLFPSLSYPSGNLICFPFINFLLFSALSKRSTCLPQTATGPLSTPLLPVVLHCLWSFAFLFPSLTHEKVLSPSIIRKPSFLRCYRVFFP